MYPIVEKRVLAPRIKSIKVKAPHVARNVKAGQFVVVRVDERGERIPLTVVDWNRKEGTILLVFQEIGVSTIKLGLLKEGDNILNISGPLGNPTEIKKYGTVICIGGGVGTACIYPVARELKKAGNNVISIVGARSSNLLILEEEIKSVSDEFYITTDDGSRGRKGFVTDQLKDILREGRKVDLVYAVGPAIMMKVVADVTRNYNIKTIVSLNPIMVDGTGMCGACRVIVGGQMKFACVDGPEFDAHEVDFDSLMSRLRTYIQEEKRALELLQTKVKGGE
ncbi:MAG: sulfide/dihydroorotate dehydrogenase-like FAD/NAD-binding protein [Thermoproteales archaeon]|nr:sulfide/dihydroorotate dehydrogenase-like FAD/NAD-binding protein [Thermoproteales archaeon]RLE67310.1 MAG: sulfide/dihydroorotate dehydrogenase-like FAD/NAD-binding protein [Thermoprotei archaeon]